MPTIRRYIQISAYSAVETHINFINPADERWLISPRTCALERITAAIRDVVKRKLTEDTRLRPGKKRHIQAHKDDVVVGEDFEVSVYLTNTGQRHSVLHKTSFLIPKKPVKSNSSKMMAAEEDAATPPPPVVIREESPDSPQMIPSTPPEPQDTEEVSTTAESPLFRPASESEDDDDPYEPPRNKGKRKESEVVDISDNDELFDAPFDDEEEKKKKDDFYVNYNGLNVDKRVLQLVVKRLDKKGKGKETGATEKKGPGMLENWIQASQAVQEEEESI